MMADKKYGHPILTIRLPQEYREALEKLGSRNDISLSTMIRWAVQEYLKHRGIDVKDYSDGRTGF